MDYEQMARESANRNRGHSDSAVAFAVLHLAEQVVIVADCLARMSERADELSDGPTSTVLHVDVQR
jgi:hypothetical protein